MPIVIPGTATGTESLILDGLDLSQGEGGAIRLDMFNPPLFRKRYEWVEGADSDGALLARDPLVSVGDATVRVAIPGVSRDDANTTVASIVAKLEEAEQHAAGIPLLWTPSDGTVTGTCYVLSGEVTEFPADWESGYMSNQPLITFTLSCAPGWYTDPVIYTGSATAGPLVTLELADVPGDVPSPGTLTITDASSQNRRTVEWGAEHRHYNPASPWSLVLDSDSLVTSGFAGTQTTLAGAYDPGASGNSIISSVVATAPQAVCGTGAQPHIGTFRVDARLNTGPGGWTNVYVRLAWRVGDGPYTTNDPVGPLTSSVQEFIERGLGTITVPEATTGTQSWDGRIEAWRSDGADTVMVDYLKLIPTEAGYGKLRASYSYTPGVISASDAFTGMAAAAALNARTPDVGAAWATSGATTDFAGETVAGVAVPGASGAPRVVRSTTADSGFRYGVLGGNMTDMEVAALTYHGGTGVITAVVARWVDASNHLRFQWVAPATGSVVGTPGTLQIVKVVAGVETVIGSTSGYPASASYYTLRVIVFSSGRAIGLAESPFGATGYVVEATDTALAGAGTLASGKPGIADKNNSGAARTRSYDDVVVSVPATEPVILYSARALKIHHNNAERESSAGGTWGRPQSYRGSRFWVRPAGDADRTTRVAVKASRNDLDSTEDANLTDQITLAVEVTPRYAVLPRP